MKIAFLFPGQGSQSVGMGQAFAQDSPAAAAVWRKADEALGFPLSRLCFEGRRIHATKLSSPTLGRLPRNIDVILPGRKVFVPR